MKTLIFTAIALFAFAANSVLCRLALGEHTIDPVAFTVIRLLSGATVLCVLMQMGGRVAQPMRHGSWYSAAMLFLYAAFFSFAYTTLDTATGALILFASVQITIILLSWIKGSRLTLLEWLGVAVAFSGFVYLVLPEVKTPSFAGLIMMTVAGIGWGAYTLKGRGTSSPVAATGSNFVRTLPFATALLLVFLEQLDISRQGVLLAMCSGALASGVGYAVWYTALPGLSSTQAAVVQLLVPIIAAAGGVLFVGEGVSVRLAVSASLVLGGILMVVLAKWRSTA